MGLYCCLKLQNCTILRLRRNLSEFRLYSKKNTQHHRCKIVDRLTFPNKHKCSKSGRLNLRSKHMFFAGSSGLLAKSAYKASRATPRQLPNRSRRFCKMHPKKDICQNRDNVFPVPFVSA